MLQLKNIKKIYQIGETKATALDGCQPCIPKK